MHLTSAQKNQIVEEATQWRESQYCSKSEAELKAMDAVFTPPLVTIKMIESFSCDSFDNMTILDPTCGSGNLLAACVIAGANPTKVYGNELDADFVELARKRLSLLGVPIENIHQGDALCSSCIEKSSFSNDYKYHKKVSLW